MQDFLAALLLASLSSFSAPHLYEKAVATMRTLPQPSYARFETTMESRGMQGTVGSVDGKAVFGFGWCHCDNSLTEQYATSFRARDHAVALILPDGKRAVTHFTLFDPLWTATDDWAHSGLFDIIDDVMRAEATPSPLPREPIQSHPKSTDLPTIAMVVAIVPSAYEVYDRGAASCANGDAGRALHLVAKSDPRKYPLTDAIVDLRNSRLCMMRFSLREGFAGPLIGATGYVQTNFGQSGRYWLASRVLVDMEFRFLHFAVKHGVFLLTYSKFAFPDAVPANDFIAEAG